jgi:hypothetical protein
MAQEQEQAKGRRQTVNLEQGCSSARARPGMWVAAGMGALCLPP